MGRHFVREEENADCVDIVKNALGGRGGKKKTLLFFPRLWNLKSPRGLSGACTIRQNGGRSPLKKKHGEKGVTRW